MPEVQKWVVGVQGSHKPGLSVVERCRMGSLKFLAQFSWVWPTFASAQQKVPGLCSAELVGDATKTPCSDPGFATGIWGTGMGLCQPREPASTAL